MTRRFAAAGGTFLGKRYVPKIMRFLPRRYTLVSARLSKCIWVSKVFLMIPDVPYPLPASCSPVPLASIAPDPKAIVVPRLHGQVLVEPSEVVLRPALLQIGNHPPVQTPPLQRLAAHARRDLYAALCSHAVNIGTRPPPSDIISRPWVITGHQCEFYHAGVWAKVLAADLLAKNTNAVAIDLLVDHDLVDEPGFAMPVRKAGELETQMVAWEKGGDLPAQFLLAPQGKKKQDWLMTIRGHAANGPIAGSDLLEDFLRRLEEDGTENFVSWLSCARFGVEQTMNVRVWHVPCSLLCSGAAWLEFVLAWMTNAREWAGVYNAALDEYRRRQSISNPGQPMPDLTIGINQIELPFWIFGDNEARQRLIFDVGTKAILVNGAALELAQLLHGNLTGQALRLKELLEFHRLHLRPRALTLTMFVRGFLANLFIHGIGGALYDRITDTIMGRLFARKPPYACVSAGWLLPFADMQNAPLNISALQVRYHHLKHNPDFVAAQKDVALASDVKIKLESLAIERQRLIADLADSLKMDRARGGHSRTGRLQRRELFRQLHGLLEQCHILYGKPVRCMDEAITQSRAALERQKVTHDREYFFALHSYESMRELQGKLRSQLAPSEISSGP